MRMRPVTKSVPVEEIVDFDDELELFERMLADPQEKRLLFIQSPGTCGKTTLLRLMKHSCKELPSCRIEFGEPFDNPHFTLALEICHQSGLVPSNMARAVAPLSSYQTVRGDATTQVEGDVTDSIVITQILSSVSLADETLRQRYMKDRLTRAFHVDLQRLADERGTIVCFFDVLEDINADEEQWLFDSLLRPIAEGVLKDVIVVTAGRRWPKLEVWEWQECAHLIERLPPLSVEDFKTYAAKVGAFLTDAEARLLWRACRGGNPTLMGTLIKNLRVAAGGGE